MPGIIPVPQRGQPLDVSYLNTIATTVNELVQQSSPKSNNITKIVRVSPQRAENAVPTTGASIYGETVNVVSGTTPANGEVPFKVNFTYQYPPIVVATAWNRGGTDAGKSVSVYVTNVTTSEANLVAKFPPSQTATIDVNVLVIGIPV